MRKSLILSLSLLFAFSSNFAQSNSTLERSFDFNDESSVSEFIIEVDDNVDNLLFGLKSVIKTGDLRISLISPNGKKEGGFRLHASPSKSDKKSKSSSTSSNSTSNSSSNSNSNTTVIVNTEGNSTESKVEVNNDSGNTFVYSTTSSSNSTSMGNMNKNISHPQAGTWKVIIDPKGVSGELLISIQQDGNH